MERLMTGPAWQKAAPSKSPSAAEQHAGARVVQHHFVRAQLKHINTHGRDDLVKQTLESIRTTAPGGNQATPAHLVEGFEHMTRRLQQANLTINFEAQSWFSKPNTYETYTQMYERAIKNFGTGASGGAVRHMVLKGDSKNPAITRDSADENATFPSYMLKSGGGFKPEFEGIGRMMSTGGLRETGKDRTGEKEYVAQNPYFNPHSKQVFAAVNYGRRPHGACVFYGKSHLVLSDRLKTDAVYFAGDTFFASDEATGIASKLPAGAVAQVSAKHQVSYQVLGACYAFANNQMKADLAASCIRDMPLPDTDKAELLLEAHLFEGLAFRGGVEKMFLVLEGPKGTELDKALKKTIQQNAEAFCKRNGIKLRVMR
jgi:hypothetical protein